MATRSPVGRARIRDAAAKKIATCTDSKLTRPIDCDFFDILPTLNSRTQNVHSRLYSATLVQRERAIWANNRTWQTRETNTQTNKPQSNRHIQRDRSSIPSMSRSEASFHLSIDRLLIERLPMNEVKKEIFQREAREKQIKPKMFDFPGSNFHLDSLA